MGTEAADAQASNPALALAASLMQTTVEGVAAGRRGPHAERRITLSIRPEVVNQGLSMAQLKPGSLVCGFVQSAQDKGLVVSTGIAGLAAAFLPFNHLSEDGFNGQRGVPLLQRGIAGAPVLCAVSNINRSAASVTLTNRTNAVAAALSGESTHTIHTVKAGMLVQATVDRVLSNGVSATFLAFFRASIHIAHLPAPATAFWATAQSECKPGQQILARVLYVDSVEKTIALSAVPHVVDLGKSAAPEAGAVGVGGPGFNAADGAVIEEAVVLRIDAGVGMLIGWGSAEDADAAATRRAQTEAGKRQKSHDRSQRRKQSKAKRKAGGAAADSEDQDDDDDEEEESESEAAEAEEEEEESADEQAADSEAEEEDMDEEDEDEEEDDEEDMDEEDASDASSDAAPAPAAAPVPAKAESKVSLSQRLGLAAQWGRTAFVHISRMVDGDAKVDNIEKLFRVGQTVRARILGFSGVDGTALASTRPTVVNASVLRAADVQPGQIVEGTVIEIPCENPTQSQQQLNFSTGKGIVAVVRLGDSATASVPALHIADVLPSKIFANAKARSAFLKAAGITLGAKIRARVLVSDPATGRIALSLKKTLLSTPLPALASYTEAATLLRERRAEGKPLLAHGVVTGVLEHGVLVTFFGGVAGLLPAADLKQHGVLPAEAFSVVERPGVDNKGTQELTKMLVEAARKVYPMGQVVKLQVTSVASTHKRMRLSTQTTTLASGAPAGTTKDAQAAASAPAAPLPASGTFVSGEIIVRDEEKDRFIVRLKPQAKTAGKKEQPQPAPVYAELAFAQLADSLSAAEASALADSDAYAVGTVLPRLLVLQRSGSQKKPAAPVRFGDVSLSSPPCLALSAKPLLTALVAAAVGQSKPAVAVPSSLSEVRRGQLVAGVVASITAFGAFVRFLDGCTGLAPRSKWPRALDAQGEETEEEVELAVGQTVVGAVEFIKQADAEGEEEKPGRFTVTLLAKSIASHLPRSLLCQPLVPTEQHSALALGARAAFAASAGALAAYTPGLTVAARVKTTGKGVVLFDMPAPAGAVTTSTPVGSATVATAASFKTGDVMRVRVLDAEAARNIVHVQVVPAEKKAGKKAAGTVFEPTFAPAAPASGLSLGTPVEAQIVFARPGAAYAVASIPGLGNATALVALRDPVSAQPLPTPKVGAAVQTVVAQLEAVAIVNAVPASVAVASVASEDSDAETEQGTNSRPAPITADSLVPGMEVTAYIPIGPKRASGDGAVEVQPAMAGEDGDDSEENTDDEDGDDESAAFTHVFGRIDPVTFRIKGVAGTYVAQLTLSECADLCPLTGMPTEESEDEAASAAVEYMAAMSSAGGGTSLQLKIASIVRETSGTGKALFRINLTARPADLALPNFELTSLRPEALAGRFTKNATEVSRIVSASTVYTIADSSITAGGPACPFAPAALPKAGADSEPLLVPGAVGFGIVEGFAADGSAIYVGLGGGAAARVSVFDCGDSDDIRDPATGALIVSEAVAAKLSAQVMRDTHPLGSVVPFVITSIGNLHKSGNESYSMVNASIRLARLAMKASRDAAADAAATPASAKKAKRDSVPAAAATFESAVAAVGKWLVAAARANAAAVAPGSLSLGLVFGAAWDFKAFRDVTKTPVSTATPVAPCAPYSKNATVLRLRLPDGQRGRVDITQTADREAWESYPLQHKYNGQVVLAVVLPTGSMGVPTKQAISNTGAEDVLLSLRASLMRIARDAAAAGSKPQSAALSGKKRRKSDADQLADAASGSAAKRIQNALDEENRATTVADQIVAGYVVHSGGDGVVVRIAPGDGAARVPPQLVADGRTTGFAKSNRPGRLVTGKVLAVDTSSGARKVRLSLRKSDVGGEADAEKEDREGVLDFASLHRGMVLDGTVNSVMDFGVFVALDKTDRTNGRGSAPQPISALCHMSELVDPSDKDAGVRRGGLSDRFSKGDRVRVVVMRVDNEARRVSVSLRPSRFLAAEAGELDESEEEEDDEDLEETDEEEDENEDMLEEGSEEEEDDEEEEEDEEDAPAAKTKPASAGASSKLGGIFGFLASGTSFTKAPAADLDVEEDEDDEPVPAAAASAKASKKARATGDDRLLSDDEDVFSDDDETGAAAVDGSEAQQLSRAQKRRLRKREKEAEEVETRRQESRLMTGEVDENPECEADFERLVAAQPNASLVWIRYMAWQLSMTEVARAREVAERALRTINFREEAEKLNVWTAFLNLEAQYGDATSLSKLFARAVAAADQRRVYSALLGIYQRAGAERAEEAEALFAAALKKFGKTAAGRDLWVQWAAFRFRRGAEQADMARALMQRALTMLPKPEHVYILLQFALLEYRFAASAAEQLAAGGMRGEGAEYGLGAGAGVGSQERGRTLLENILSVAPKRLDIWNVYLDQEITSFARRFPAEKKKPGKAASASHAAAAARAADLTAVRNLFDRVLSLKLSSKKVKFALKKYLQFEKTQGDAAGVSKVQAAAKAYVESQVGAALSKASAAHGASQAGNDDEDDEDMDDDM
jgi:ribosomal protein S1